MNELILGDCLEVMKTFPDNHFTGIVTDPPYGLKFKGKKWDHGIPGVEFWKEMLRICAPGSWLMAFGGTRTYHRLTCLIEDAGWGIRDCLMWLYGSGFPKSKGSLKPAYEPIILARKKQKSPLLNIDQCRLNTFCKSFNEIRKEKKSYIFSCLKGFHYDGSKGRWPTNVILDEESHETLGDASRFFYCSKPTTSERRMGCDDLKTHHPTVKPIKLMEYFIKLITPFENNHILDPFAGSGSTLIACKNLSIKYTGIEKEESYVQIAKARLSA